MFRRRALSGNLRYGKISPDSSDITTKLNEGKFEDLEKAIRWSKLLVGLQDHIGITLLLGKVPLENLTISNRENSLPQYKDWLEYCMNIYVIEKEANTILPYYDGFTPNNFLFSKIICSYLRHEAFIDKPRGAFQSFTVDVDKGSFQGDGDYVARIVTKINNPVSLCGVEYSIAEERVFFQHCRIESKEIIDDKKERLHFSYTGETVQYEYCDEDESLII